MIQKCGNNIKVQTQLKIQKQSKNQYKQKLSQRIIDGQANNTTHQGLNSSCTENERIEKNAFF